MTFTEECVFIIELGRYSFDVNDNLCYTVDNRYPYWKQPDIETFI